MEKQGGPKQEQLDGINDRKGSEAICEIGRVDLLRGAALESEAIQGSKYFNPDCGDLLRLQSRILEGVRA